MIDIYMMTRKLASQYKELFDALVEMGFTDEQAMTILVALIGAPVG